jgi:type IV pilus assembly protein PilM
VSDSIWKKEISLGRKPKAEAPAAGEQPPGSESIWKKEITLGRKPKAEAPAADEQPPGSESIWKKEISFRRKSARSEEVERLTREAEEAQLARAVRATQSAAYADADRLAADAEAARLAAEAEAARLAAEAQAAAPSPEEQVERLAREAARSVTAEFQAEFTPESPVAPLLEAVLGDAAPTEPVGAPQWEEPAGWDAAPELPREPEAVEAPRPAAPAPAAAWPEPALPAPEPPAAAPEPVAHVPEPAASEAAAPAPAAAAEPEPAVPFWKREVRLGKPRAKHPAESRPSPKRRLPRPSLRLPSPRRGGGGGGGGRIVGLKIGGSQIAAARVANDGGASLEQVARRSLRPGIVVGGELREPEALAAELKAFFAEHKLPHRNVRLGIASGRIGVRIFEISGIEDERQFENAVRFRAQEALPVPLDEAVLDHRVLGETTNDEGEIVRRVLLVVAHKDLVDRYVAACRQAGLTLSGVDLEAFALLRSVSAPADRSGSALVAAALGHDRTTLAVSDGRVCEFTRVLEWGGWSLNVALARVLDSTPADVEWVKRGLSLSGGPAPEGLSPEQAVAAVEALRRSVESFARELIASLQFYQAQPGSLGIGEVVITGGTAQLTGLAQELERLLGVPVRVGDPLARLKVGKQVDDSELGSLAVAIGLGIED